MQAVLTVAVGQGAAALSMRAIARELGMQPASLYSHFHGGKEEILEQTLRWNYIEFLDTLLASVPDGAEAVDEFRGIVAGQINFQMDSSWQNLFEALVVADRMGQFLSASARETVTELRGMYLDYIEAVVIDISPGPVTRARSWAVVNFLNDISSFAALLPGEATRAELVDHALACALGVIRAADPGERAAGTSRLAEDRDTSRTA